METTIMTRHKAPIRCKYNNPPVYNCQYNCVVYDPVDKTIYACENLKMDKKEPIEEDKTVITGKLADWGSVFNEEWYLGEENLKDILNEIFKPFDGDTIELTIRRINKEKD